MMKQIAYEYKNMPIPGGGYVTGFLFHPKQENVLYIRTDIGGCYKYDYDSDRWHSLTESVGMEDLRETYPIALASDRNHPEKLYIASGVNQNVNGRLSLSDDYGNTFLHKDIPCYVHGNMNGRGTGYRLVTDPLDGNILYFASQRDGLLKTKDLGDTWERLETGNETYMTFVWVSPDGNTLVSGSAGVVTGNEAFRGHSLTISYDRGDSFEPLIMPENIAIPNSRWSGYVAHRYDYDGTYLYVTLVNTGERSYVKELGYSCDSGDVMGGRIIRYHFEESGRIGGYDDITPTGLAGAEGTYEVSIEDVLPFGFGGISSCPVKPGMLAASSLCKDDGDMLFLSFDYGKSWEPVLYDLSIGNLWFESAYMKPQFNGGHSILHWLTDVKINPYHPEELWFNTGTGVFVSDKLTSCERNFHDCSKGIEETVHLNVYGPVDGPVKALDIVGDLGGFAFTDLDIPCENSFADDTGNRYITCINADFSDLHPETVIVTARGNWKGKTKGGLILSKDYGLHFNRISLPYGISEYLDKLFQEIERPNVNPGWAAISSDTQTICYCVGEGIDLFMKGAIVSNDGGNSFHKTSIYNLEGMEITASNQHFKIFSDRIYPDLFYGFGDGFTLYISKDKGNSFRQIDTSHISCAEAVFGLIDCANKTEVRGDAGKAGVFYAAVGEYGLFQITFYPDADKADAVRLTMEGEEVYRVGLGILSPESNYLTDHKALYICGIIQDVYGFFRSLNNGSTWEKINNEAQMFGSINSIDGDSRTFGRYFIATGSFGVKYGQQKF